MKKNCRSDKLLNFVAIRKKLILKMKLVGILICIIGLTGSYASVYSQQTKLNLNVRNTAIKDVLKQIEDLSEYSFMYNASKIDVYRKVDINVENSSLEKILNTIFEGEDINYKVINKIVIISPNTAFPAYESVQPPISVSGKVSDSSGSPLPGVTVVVKGTTQGTITDADGNYSISNVPSDATLVFSFVGMKTQEIVVEGKTTINVTMAEEAIGIEEVVAVGYGTQIKANLTGAVTQVKVDKVLRSRPVTNIATALEGSLPGVQITSSSGRPGEQSDIDIRGMMSINGGSPLVLVDNVPMNIHDLNPADIESVSVLKDAAASAIYGGRAAFGVILITTKKASRNEPIKFNYTSNLVFSQATDLPEKASTLELIDAFQAWGNSYYPTGQDLATWKGLLTEYQDNPSNYPDGKAYIGELVYPLAEYDLYDYTFENSFEQIHNFSFSGGTEKSDFRGSFGYADEDGIMITDKDSYKKFNVNLYINTSLTKKLTSTTNVLYLNDKRLTPARYSSLFYLALRMPSFNYDPTGYYTDDEGFDVPYSTPDNYLKLEPADQSSNRKLRMLEKLVYRFNDDITVTGEYTYINSGYDYSNSLSGREYIGVIGGNSIQYFGSPSYYYRSNSNTDYHALNLYASYKKILNNHNISLLVGMNQELSKYSAFQAKKTDLMDIENPSLATALGTMTNDESFSDYSISGYFSRLNYSYKNKYLLEANIRYDGSSKFPEGDRYGLFPSVSAGWVVSEEPFMEPIKNTLSFLKLRGSWGEIGNQSISNYAYISSMSTYDASWIDLATNIKAFTIAPPALVSGSFTWETVRTKNIGVDINFFDNKLNSTFDYYIRETLDMLGPGAELPKVLGTDAPEQNVADLESKGWDCNIEWRENINDDLSYSIGVNVSDNRSYVTKYDNESGVLSQYYNGYEFGEIWGYVTDGYFTVDDFEAGTLDDNLMNGTLKEGIPAFYTVVNQNPGDIRYADLDGDGEISPGSSTLSDPGDRKIIGNSRKRYQFGITGNITYKNFDFSVFINGVGKCDLWPYINLNNRDDVNFIFWPYSDQYAPLYKNQLDYWTPENTDAYYMRNYYGATGNTKYSRNTQTKYLLNGAYIRLKNVELGYTLPKRLSEKLFINYARLFVSVENLLKFDHLPKGMDNEVTTTYNTGGVYPYYRKFNFGVNISF